VTRFVTLGALNCLLVAALIAGRGGGQSPVVVPYNAAAYGGPSPVTAADVRKALDLLESMDRRLASIEAKGGAAPAAVRAADLAAVAKQHCFRCHGPEAADAKGDGFQMFAADGSMLKLKPFEMNRIRQTVLEGSMPKTGPKPTPAERAVFEAMK